MGRIRTSKWSVLITFSFLYYSWILLLIKVNYVIWRIDAFELWSWRRLLRVPWTARRSNQSILKEISPDIHWKDWSLKLQYFGHLMGTDSCEKTLILGKIEGGRRSGWQRMRWLDGITDSMEWVWASCRSWWWTGKPVCCSPWGHRVRHDWSDLAAAAASTKEMMLLNCRVG